jgi:glucose-1-phosphate cytidylyltransferase
VQVVILCGGKGTRLGEVTGNEIPKPMALLGNEPILLHLMGCYARQGYRRFVLCAGHLSWCIKDYFLNYHARTADLRISTNCADVEFLKDPKEDDWEIVIAETGAETQTAGRIARAMKYIDGDAFMLTYGDGLADVDLPALEAFHRAHGKAITVTGIAPPGRFGELVLDGDRVVDLAEKPVVSDRYINGGFMVINRDFCDRFIGKDADDVMLERAPMAKAAAAGEMMIWRHSGFWQCMDTYRDWSLLNELWQGGRAPWT